MHEILSTNTIYPFQDLSAMRSLYLFTMPSVRFDFYFMEIIYILYYSSLGIKINQLYTMQPKQWYIRRNERATPINKRE